MSCSIVRVCRRATASRDESLMLSCHCEQHHELLRNISLSQRIAAHGCGRGVGPHLPAPVTNLTKAFLPANSQLSSTVHKHRHVMALLLVASPASSSSSTLKACCTLKSAASSALQPQIAAARCAPCKPQSCSTCSQHDAAHPPLAVTLTRLHMQCGCTDIMCQLEMIGPTNTSHADHCASALTWMLVPAAKPCLTASSCHCTSTTSSCRTACATYCFLLMLVGSCSTCSSCWYCWRGIFSTEHMLAAASGSCCSSSSSVG